MISIVTSLFNNRKKCSYAYEMYIENMQKQTCQDFQIIAVDDGCSDDSPDLLLNSGLNVHMIRNGKNRGLTRSLIKAIKWLRSNSPSDYIVCHDADDFSDTDRLEKQLDFLENNKEVHVLNSSVRICDKRGNIISEKVSPITNDEIYEILKERNPFFHSAVMMRASIFDKVKYDKQRQYAQDYALWTDCARNGFVFAGMEDRLVTRCKHKNALSMKYPSNSLQRHIAKRIRWEYNQWLENQ